MAKIDSLGVKVNVDKKNIKLVRDSFGNILFYVSMILNLSSFFLCFFFIN